MAKAPLFVFLDEGGNLDFSPKGSKYFTLTSIVTSDPFLFTEPLARLRYDLLCADIDSEYFHASEDQQKTRDAVFNVILPLLGHIRADSVIVEKSKTGPSVRDELRFYPMMLGYLLKYVFNGMDLSGVEKVVVITDSIPLNSKRKAIVKAIKQELPSRLPSTVPYSIFHHCSRAHTALQVADYINWAIYRKWDRGDERSLKLVQSAVRSQFDIFRMGSKHWY